MEQSDIFYEITSRFSEKFKKLTKVKIRENFEEEKKETEPTILITLLGIEELFNQNMNQKIQKKGADAKGNSIEYFVPPASEFRLTYMVTPYLKTYTDCLKILGAMVKTIKDDHLIPVDQMDWVENENYPVRIYPLPEMPIDKQMNLMGMLKLDYRPSLFYYLDVGIDSEQREIFGRVEERKISAVKLEKKKPVSGIQMVEE